MVTRGLAPKDFCANSISDQSTKLRHCLDRRFDIEVPRLRERPCCLILMATRNGAAHIDRQLRSLLAQLNVHVSVDVRDDCSSDVTRDIVNRFITAGAPVRMRLDHDATGSAAGNFFKLILDADLSGVDYVSLSDQDDEWAVDKLSRAVACLRASGADGYSSGVLAVWPSGRTKPLVQNPHVREGDCLFEGAGQGCTFVIKATLFAELQVLLRRHQALLAPVRYHDWTVYALTRALGRRWYFDQNLTMQYLQHAGNDTGARNSGDGALRRLKLIRQGWYRAQVNAIVDLILAVQPSNSAAAEWRALSKPKNAAPHEHGPERNRWQRLCFVAGKGRRRLSDRAILVAAVLLGYL